MAGCSGSGPQLEGDERLAGETARRRDCAHPLKVRALAEAKIKADKVDATTLAHLLRCDLIPAAHVRSPQIGILTNLLRHRMSLVRLQTMTENRFHVFLDGHSKLIISRSGSPPPPTYRYGPGTPPVISVTKFSLVEVRCHRRSVVPLPSRSPSPTIPRSGSPPPPTH
ncbi:MAG: transposase [Phycisphaerales bacterium]|nr:MAG: transposase [Phycisphaerales bacterium]